MKMTGNTFPLKGMFKQQQSFILKIKNAVQQINGILNG